MIEPNVLRPVRTEYGKKIRKEYEAGNVKESRHNMTQLMPRDDGISNTLTTVLKDNLVAEPFICASRGRNPDNPSARVAGLPTEQRLEINMNGTTNTLTTVQKDNLLVEPSRGFRIRKLTPKECWRLMGFDDEDYEKAAKVNSNTQLYKQAGNSIVVNVLEAIFKNLFTGEVKMESYNADTQIDPKMAEAVLKQLLNNCQKKANTGNEYQKLAARTINKKLSPTDMEFHALHGMVGEIGEIHSIYQKVYQGHKVEPVHLMKELGDLMWFVAEFCSANCWNLDDVMEMNIDKLKARYPEGFDADHSLNRAEGDI